MNKKTEKYTKEQCNKRGGNMTVDKTNSEKHATKAKSKHDILQDLNTQLTLRAERMRLLTRAEEGLVSESFNPSSTKTIATSKSIADDDRR